MEGILQSAKTRITQSLKEEKIKDLEKALQEVLKVGKDKIEADFQSLQKSLDNLEIYTRFSTISAAKIKAGAEGNNQTKALQESLLKYVNGRAEERLKRAENEFNQECAYLIEQTKLIGKEQEQIELDQDNNQGAGEGQRESKIQNQNDILQEIDEIGLTSSLYSFDPLLKFNIQPKEDFLDWIVQNSQKRLSSLEESKDTVVEGADWKNEITQLQITTNHQKKEYPQIFSPQAVQISNLLLYPYPSDIFAAAGWDGLLTTLKADDSNQSITHSFTAPITALAWLSSTNEIAVAGQPGKVSILESGTFQVIKEIHLPGFTADESIISLIELPDQSKSYFKHALLVVTDNHVLQYDTLKYELMKHSEKNEKLECPLPQSFLSATTLNGNYTQQLLFVGASNGAVFVYQNMNFIGQIKIHKDWVHLLQVTSENQDDNQNNEIVMTIVTGSHDETLIVTKLSLPLQQDQTSSSQQLSSIHGGLKKIITNSEQRAVIKLGSLPTAMKISKLLNRQEVVEVALKSSNLIYIYSLLDGLITTLEVNGLEEILEIKTTHDGNLLCCGKSDSENGRVVLVKHSIKE